MSIKQVIHYYENGTPSSGAANKKSEEWFKGNRRHREDGPAIIIYLENGTIIKEEWYKNDLLSRENGPAHIAYYENGNKETEGWYKNGKVHRTDDYAFFEYYENGNLESKYYHINGLPDEWFDTITNKHYPSTIEYYQNGNIKSLYWFKKDKLHRLEDYSVI